MSPEKTGLNLPNDMSGVEGPEQAGEGEVTELDKGKRAFLKLLAASGLTITAATVARLLLPKVLRPDLSLAGVGQKTYLPFLPKVLRPPLSLAQVDDDLCQTYFPLVDVNRPEPDIRFGIAELNLQEMEALGFPFNKERSHSNQWPPPFNRDTVFFARSAHRCPTWKCKEPLGITELYCLWLYQFEGEKNLCTGQTATETGLVNPEGLGQFLSAHPWVSVIIGNEESANEVNDGLSDMVTPEQYARWYAEMWDFIKDNFPNIRVGPYGPVQHYGEDSSPQTDFFKEWRRVYKLNGKPVPQNFQTVHFYLHPEFIMAEAAAALEWWLRWMKGHIDGPTPFILTEYGLQCWKSEIPREGEEVERCMREFTCWLMSTNHFESWVWWAACYLIGEDGQPTALGRLYRQLAVGVDPNGAPICE